MENIIMKLRVLAVGDVSGTAGVEYLRKNLRRRIDEWDVALTVVSGENAADIHGISEADAHDIFAAGADVITTGNHAFGRRDSYRLYDDMPTFLRPDNYPPAAPGCGSVIVSAAGVRVLCMNLQGNVAMGEALACPFASADAILSREAGKYDIALLDFHAEATSEKAALGIYLDGRVSAVWGTHTHVPTADERILRGGTAFVTDIGMTGPADGVLGVDADVIIRRYTSCMPQKFRMAEGRVTSTGVLIDIDADSGKALAIKRCLL